MKTESKSGVLYCPHNKVTGEYVTDRYEPTRDIFEAIGWRTTKLCKEDISNFDEPEDWDVAIKVINISMMSLSDEDNDEED